MSGRNAKLNTLASNPVLAAMREAYKPYVELKRRERQMILALMRQRKVMQQARLAVANQ